MRVRIERKKLKTKSRRKLVRVIVVRHGEYSDCTGKLNLEGVRQMQRLAGHLRKQVQKRQTVEIFSSPTTRAKQSAEIIARQLGVSYSVCPALESGGFDDGQLLMERLLKSRNGGNILIAVTHCEAPSGIINAFAEKYFGVSVNRGESQKGDGYIICLKTGQIRTSSF